MTHIINDNGIDRPMTPDEIAAWEQIQQDRMAAEAEREAQLEARKAPLRKLGLTDDEINAVLGF